ncbi:hypothetical protein DSCA_05640 [Desulfosarcina alkanivorans]|jgi:hypothetical protein|uniref:DUF3887 domain-containing protein n=1 Tax=Desulfosarcina alkanivorans TaxID=571177 RepID=A0A5K7YJV4_9BACT|nr:hypothetical protein [Desulfosarcina alkanivorans]BBO66634.1 hypothetical protein DSCA_05640 [Desulfosarcina alkanivorans]
MNKNTITTILILAIIVFTFTTIKSQSQSLNMSPEIRYKIKKNAFNAYFKKMNLNVLAEEGVRDINIIKLKSSIKGFASKNEEVYEVRIKTIGNELRAILYVNSKDKVHFVSGQWD